MGITPVVTDGQGSQIPPWMKNVLPWLIQFGTIIWFLASLKGEVKYMGGTVTDIKNDAAVTKEAIVEIKVDMGKIQTRVDNLEVVRPRR